MRRLPALLLAAIVLVVFGFAPGTHGGFTADIHSASSAGSGTQFVTATASEGTQMCSSVPASTVPSTTVFPCSGSLFLPTSNNSPRSISVVRSGNTLAQASTIQGLSCGPVSGVNTQDATNPVLTRNGATLGTTPTPKGSTGLLVTGTTSDATTVNTIASTAGFTQSVWFRTTKTTPNVGIMGTSTSAIMNTGSQDNQFDTLSGSGGVLRFRYTPNGTQVGVTSNAGVMDNSWHFAAVTVTNASPMVMSLYLDGIFQNSTTFAQGTIIKSSYMHVGSLGYGQPVEGAVSNAAIWPAPLAASDIQNLYNAPTQSAYSGLVSSLNATGYWPLTDNGYSTFAGPYTPIGAASPCDYAGMTVFDGNNACVYPVVASSCSSTDTMTNFVSRLTALPQLALGQTQTLKFQVRRGTANSWADGLQLLMPIAIKQTSFDQTFTWSNNRILLTP